MTQARSRPKTGERGKQKRPLGPTKGPLKLPFPETGKNLRANHRPQTPSGLSMYARGMTTREMTAHLKEIYGVEVSPELGSPGYVDCRSRRSQWEYTAAREEEAVEELEQFAHRWDTNYPMISRSWNNRWAEIIPFLTTRKQFVKPLIQPMA